MALERLGYLDAEDVADTLGVSAVVGLNVGVAAPADIVDRQSADIRYVQQDQAAAPVYTAYTAPTISATPTQAEVQAIANALASASAALATLITRLQTTNTLS